MAQSILSGKFHKADILATSRESRPPLVPHKPDVQPWLEISDLKSRTIVHSAKTKKQITCAMSAQQVCVPVFTFAKSKFSHGVTLLISLLRKTFRTIISMFFKPTTQEVFVVSRVLFNSSYHSFSVKVNIIFRINVRV